MRMFRWMGCGFGVFLLFTGNAFAATRYVNVSNAAPAAPYTGWGIASTNIQAAITAAASGDEILVAPGIYRINSTVLIPANKTLTLRSTQSRAAVIDAQRLCRGLEIWGTNSMVEGFTIRNGLTNSSGGGIYILEVSTVRDCLVVSNQASNGGGIVNYSSGTVVENCTIQGNLATNMSGGVYGSVPAQVNNCVIRDNIASNGAGGIYLYRDGIISNCWISGNRTIKAGANGGGVYLTAAGGPTIGTVVNSVICNNSAPSLGGGIYVAGSTGVQAPIINCTVVSNSAGASGGGISCNSARIINSIIYFNAAPEDANLYQSWMIPTVVSNCCVIPMPWTNGLTCFTNAPAFVNRAGLDFHLVEGSSCIDAGTTLQAPGNDYDGNRRPVVGVRGGTARYDVGAFEYLPAFAPADFDGDGIADVAVFRPADGNWSGQLSGGGSGNQAFGSKTMVPVPADYDGDGTTDLALYQPTTCNWFILYSGGGSRKVKFGANSAMVPLPGDYDGDGKADLALFYPAQVRWYFFGSTEGYSSVQFGGKSDVPVPADYDGDGVTDVAVYRPSSGTWYVIYSGGGSRVTQLGWAGTVPVPADYDGDGRADIAVLSRASSTWCISYSNGGSLIQEFGYKTMTPVPADYDGDGRADLAMYHAATGKWYIRQSTTGAHRQVVLGGAGQLPVLLYPLIHSWFGLP